MNLQPLFDQVSIRPRVNSDVSRGGLAIPDIAKSNTPYRYGEVVAVGTGRVNAEGRTIPCAVKPGDVVAYAKGAGLEFPIESETGEEVLLLIQERYILGIATGLPTPTRIQGVDGRLLAMTPFSRANPDSAYKNRDDIDRAVRNGWETADEHTDEPNDAT